MQRCRPPPSSFVTTVPSTSASRPNRRYFISVHFYFCFLVAVAVAAFTCFIQLIESKRSVLCSMIMNISRICKYVSTIRDKYCLEYNSKWIIIIIVTDEIGNEKESGETINEIPFLWWKFCVDFCFASSLSFSFFVHDTIQLLLYLIFFCD